MRGGASAVPLLSISHISRLLESKYTLRSCLVLHLCVTVEQLEKNYKKYIKCTCASARPVERDEGEEEIALIYFTLSLSLCCSAVAR